MPTEIEETLESEYLETRKGFSVGLGGENAVVDSGRKFPGV